MVAPDKLTPRQIMAVRCPVCQAVPREQCKLSSGKPCIKTHLDRQILASKVTLSENLGQTTVRLAKKTFNILFPQR
jgi:hypothetical protein